MSTPSEIKNLREKVDRLKTQVERARGRAEMIRKTLKDDWDCKNLSEAKKLLSELQATQVTLREDYDTKLGVFEGRWKDVLSTVE